MYQSLKLISRPGTERIVRYAFAYARAYGRSKVTCMTKDNIMKLTDGTFHKVFDEVAQEYPEITAEHMIVDIGAARLADTPEDFDVVVTLNLYGDVLSDVTAQIAGSVGLGGSANVGERVAMFEAIHGTAPDIAGRDIANPSGMLMAATQMLVHVGQPEVAERIANAWLRTLEDGVHTGDVYRAGTSRERVGTESFADAVIARLGELPRQLSPVHYRAADLQVHLSPPVPVDQGAARRRRLPRLVRGRPRAERLGDRPGRGCGGGRVDAQDDHEPGRPRLPGRLPRDASAPTTGAAGSSRRTVRRRGFAGVLELLAAVDGAGLEVIKTEHLYDFDGEPGYSLAQGE